MIDGSSSVGERQFEKQVRFLIAMTKKFEISPQSARIGLIQYNYKPITEFDFLSDSNEVGVALTNLEYKKGGTWTGKAMKSAWNEFFKNNPRKASKAIVVITDGKSDDNVTGISKKLKKNGINVLALGYNKSNKEQLLQIAGGDSSKVFQGTTVQSLARFNEQLVKKICKV